MLFWLINPVWVIYSQSLIKLCKCLSNKSLKFPKADTHAHPPTLHFSPSHKISSPIMNIFPPSPPPSHRISSTISNQCTLCWNTLICVNSSSIELFYHWFCLHGVKGVNVTWRQVQQIFCIVWRVKLTSVTAYSHPQLYACECIQSPEMFLWKWRISIYARLIYQN